VEVLKLLKPLSLPGDAGMGDQSGKFLLADVAEVLREQLSDLVLKEFALLDVVGLLRDVRRAWDSTALQVSLSLQALLNLFFLFDLLWLGIVINHFEVVSQVLLVFTHHLVQILW
jgi:hypothetical protein